MIISTTIFTAYAIICYLQFGITKDFSATFYKWKEKYPATKKHLLFPAWILGITFPLLFKIETLQYWFRWEHSFWWFGWIPVLAIALLWLVFFAPNYRAKPFNVIHVIGASGGIAVFMFYVLLLKTWYFAIPFVVFMLLIKKGKLRITNLTYWTEFLAYASIWLAVYFN